MQIDLRNASPDDAALLAEMNQQLIEDEGSITQLSMPELESRMRKWLTHDYTAVILCKDDEAIGYLLYQQRHDPFDAHKAYMYVRQYFLRREYRRRGIGRRAFEEVVSCYFPPELPVMLEVLACNPRGQHFWESLGFDNYSMMLRRDSNNDGIIEP